MTNSVQMQMMLANIQNQLNTLNGMATPATVTPPPTTPTYPAISPTPPDINAMIKAGIQSELSRLGINAPKAGAVGAANNNVPNIPTPNPAAALLPIIGAAFNTAQQEWISQPQNLLGIPGFLMSSDGKSLLNMALESYQQFCSSATQPAA